MESITLIKLGGSVITDKNTPYTARIHILNQLAKELASCKGPLIIAHGSGSFGHTSAQQFGGKKGYTSKAGIGKLCFDATWINHIVMHELINQHLPVISLHPFSLIRTSAGKVIQHNFEIVEDVLRQGLIPVVYGDVISDISWNTTIFSGEKVLAEIADFLLIHGYLISKIIQVGNTDGFYGADHKVISTITPETWNTDKAYLFSTNTTDVTGGMKHKIEEALALTEKGIRTILINGELKGELTNALQDKHRTGTVIQPSKKIIQEEEEYVVLVTEENNPIGRSPKLATHNHATKRHRGFSLFLFNEKKQLLLQQRSHTKKTWPMVWSNSCCGHPKEDELPEDAAQRRLAYELGITDAKIEMILPDYQYTCEKDGIVENEFCPVMVGFSQSSPNLNPDEVEAVKWISWVDWLSEVKTHPERYSQWCIEETMLLQNEEKFKKLIHL